MYQCYRRGVERGGGGEISSATPHYISETKTCIVVFATKNSLRQTKNRQVGGGKDSWP